MPSHDLTLTLTLTQKQPFELARTTQNILSLQKCPQLEMKKVIQHLISREMY